MKYSLCIEPIFEELPFYERFQKAKALGCDAVEFWSPWNNREGVTPEGLGKASVRADIPIAAASLEGNLCMPWEVLQKKLAHSFENAKQMGTTTLIGVTGNATGDPAAQTQQLLENLKRTAELAEKAGVTIAVEALNSKYDHKGYFLDTATAGLMLCQQVGSNYIKLLYDCYHMQLMEGDLTNQIKDNIAWIGHFHSAGVPGRHELQLGEVNYPNLVEMISMCGYAGYFGLEYFPSRPDVQSVTSVLDHLRNRA